MINTNDELCMHSYGHVSTFLSTMIFSFDPILIEMLLNLQIYEIKKNYLLVPGFYRTDSLIFTGICFMGST